MNYKHPNLPQAAEVRVLCSVCRYLSLLSTVVCHYLRLLSASSLVSNATACCCLHCLSYLLSAVSLLSALSLLSTSSSN
ncbi:hypothetical protein [Paenibacillus tepidiphilus]|uniref:hypothetical protein n=1 Tax=Paenibacillus tepidiphilus TaxID=2608683 RepID=UPI0012386DFD|nr:hypothetical protein [Paenibacillus tepidiphilus]